MSEGGWHACGDTAHGECGTNIYLIHRLIIAIIMIIRIYNLGYRMSKIYVMHLVYVYQCICQNSNDTKSFPLGTSTGQSPFFIVFKGRLLCLVDFCAWPGSIWSFDVSSHQLHQLHQLLLVWTQSCHPISIKFMSSAQKPHVAHTSTSTFEEDSAGKMCHPILGCQYLDPGLHWSTSPQLRLVMFPLPNVEELWMQL